MLGAADNDHLFRRAQYAAEALQVPRTVIEPRVGSSDYPAGPGSGGSQTARSLAPAVVDACLKAVDKLRGVVAKAWGVSTRDVRYGKGTFRGKGKKAKGAMAVEG